MKGRPLIRHLAAAALGLICALLLVEGLLWLIDDYDYQALVYDPENGLIHYQPGITYHSVGTCYDIEAHMNALGVYGPEITPEKAPGTYRIIVVGSSFVEGIQVPLTERFDTRLETELNARGDGRHYEVVGLGFPANGTYLTMLYYRYYYAALHPDLVIDLITDSSLGKDAPDTTDAPRFDASGTPILELPAAKRGSFVLNIKSAARHSKLFEALYHDYLIARTPAPSMTSAPSTATTTDPYTASWDSETKLLPAFKPIVVDSGAKFMLASWATSEITDRTYMSAHLTPVAAASGIPYLDLTPILDEDEASTGKSAMLACNGHWGTQGHQWVAEALYDYLTAHPSFL